MKIANLAKKVNASRVQGNRGYYFLLRNEKKCNIVNFNMGVAIKDIEIYDRGYIARPSYND